MFNPSNRCNKEKSFHKVSNVGLEPENCIISRMNCLLGGTEYEIFQLDMKLLL